MRSYTRKQLKQDEFAEAAKGTATWVVAHQRKLTIALVVVAIVGGGLLGGWFYLQYQDGKASTLLGEALRIYHAPLDSANIPAGLGITTYPTAAKRAETALPKFREIVEKYPLTRTADVARYYVGLASADAGDNDAAQKALQEVSASRDKDLAALAKFALASLYRESGRKDQAAGLYKQLVENPSRTVPKQTAQLELASLYEKDQPQEAVRIYEQIRVEDANSVAAQIASARLAEVRR